MSLSYKRVIVAISGGIAAYKSLELIRLLLKQQVHVKVIMTKGALAFITPLTIQALTGSQAHTELLDESAEAGMGHIELARWCQLLIIAPASANVIARIANGQADDLLTTVMLATKATIAIVPAMNTQMWQKESVQTNIQKLKSRNYRIWGPSQGIQACGDEGFGRMIEPQSILNEANQLFDNGLLKNKKVVITAGPTLERIDPVRYISNFSSGKMAYAIAAAAEQEGADVVVIRGPVKLKDIAGVATVKVESAEQMLAASIEHTKQCDIFVAAAAVADYRPIATQKQKHKKGNDDTFILKLQKNPDILQHISHLKKDSHCLLVGFAAETQNVVAYGTDKLHKKGVDLIVANDVSCSDIGFNSDINQVHLISHNKVKSLSKMSKKQIGVDLVDQFAQLIKK